MDQKKIGEFLRELRKEKGLTQAQMAEHFNIAARTVSRWETGANMPDIGIIGELADFFEVDIRELINGERDAVPADSEDTVSKVIEYADEEKRRLTRKLSAYSIAGLAAAAVFVILTESGADQNLFASAVEGISLMTVYFALTQNLLYTAGRLEKQTEKRKKQSVKAVLLKVLLAFGALVLVSAIVSAFLVKSA